jgi:hypothetical protein
MRLIALDLCVQLLCVAFFNRGVNPSSGVSGESFLCFPATEPGIRESAALDCLEGVTDVRSWNWASFLAILKAYDK